MNTKVSVYREQRVRQRRDVHGSSDMSSRDNSLRYVVVHPDLSDSSRCGPSQRDFLRQLMFWLEGNDRTHV